MSIVACARLKAAIEDCDTREPGRRLRDTDYRIANDQTRTVKFYAEGSLLTVQRDPMWEPYQDEKEGTRGKVKGFSAKSRKRFLAYVASISRHVLPLFVTLTYPSDWPDAWKHWKEHLNRWWSNHVERKWKGAAAVWKLEPQERGAPHFHLVVWGIPYMPPEWLARSWYECVGSGDERHLRAGTRVERARSFKGVMCDAARSISGRRFKRREDGETWAGIGAQWVVRTCRCPGSLNSRYPRNRRQGCVG